ncbi:uncharacterized protein B0H18DRAFT_1212098 [Fomitopsis serialis]|uniref:uncharacterized protein n=1 Tax=Fomitopsis serialis TaxID=139415 RepID=UPI002008042B|nr:uncharacterized protein B0H18DRAFT_1212098 [Neoantrodia serialis]KAH9923892.1 hypothetical protein B0H18DRAFT_1212098 [Neoantrodia serialis]
MSEGSSHCPSTLQLPVEVCERIINHIAMGWDISHHFVADEPHVSTLASCALVCQDWYFLTWYHLRQRIHLRDRKDVLSLSKTLHAKPRLREVVRQVVISGASPGKRQPIRHLGTFAAMLANRAPALWRITIQDAEWTTGSVRREDIAYLAAFGSIGTLIVRKVTLSSVAQLSCLVSALPRLRALWCVNVSCLQKQQVSPVSLPLNCANLEGLEVRWAAPAVEEFFVQISWASRVRFLNLGVVGEVDPSSRSATSRSQTVLDASSASAETVALHIDPRFPVRDARHYNFSRHDHLRRLAIWLYHPFAEWPWIPHILSHIVSKHFQAMSVMLVVRTAHMADDLDGMLTTMGRDDALARLDSILQEKRFSGTIASRGVCIGIHYDNDSWASGDEQFGMGLALRERHNRWDELVRQKMPHSHGRGIVTTVHNFQEFDNWKTDVVEIRTSMPAEETNANLKGEA